MNNLNFIRSVLAKIESLKEGTIAYGYQNSNESGKFSWIEICVNDYNLYSKDERFKSLTRAWHKIATKRGIRLLFCYRPAREKILANYAENDNLLLNF